MEKFLNKKYKLDRVENFDEFFIEMGEILFKMLHVSFCSASSFTINKNICKKFFNQPIFFIEKK